MKKGRIHLVLCMVAVVLIPALVFAQGVKSGAAPKGYITIYWDEGYVGFRWNPDTQQVEGIVSVVVYEDEVSLSVNFHFFVDEEYFELKMDITSGKKGNPPKHKGKGDSL